MCFQLMHVPCTITYVLSFTRNSPSKLIHLICQEILARFYGMSTSYSTKPIKIKWHSIKCACINQETKKCRKRVARASCSSIMHFILLLCFSEITDATIPPTSLHSLEPSANSTGERSTAPSNWTTSYQPTTLPSLQPSRYLSNRPSAQLSSAPTAQPTSQPSCQPSANPTSSLLAQPSSQPSSQPSAHPSAKPSATQSTHPN